MKIQSSLLVATALGSLLFQSGAGAATIVRGESGTGSAICQGALPAYEGAIRKRPLSIQNEGTAVAFITCAFVAPSAPSNLKLWFNSATGVTVPITCTAVNGYNTQPAIAYSVKSVSTLASGQQTSLEWTPSDFGGTSTFPRGAHISVSCSLPPGAGLNDFHLFYSVDIGN